MFAPGEFDNFLNMDKCRRYIRIADAAEVGG